MTDPTLADYAELWCKDQGIPVPEREAPEWAEMYERWIDYAFADFRETVSENVQPKGGKCVQ